MLENQQQNQVYIMFTSRDKKSQMKLLQKSRGLQQPPWVETLTEIAWVEED